MSLIDNARHLFAPSRRDILPLQFNQLIDYFNYTGTTYPYQTLTGSSWAPERLSDAYSRSGVVFACVLARAMLFAEARLTFRQIRNGTPGKLFGTSALSIFEHPWQDATTGDLLTRAIIDSDLVGNFYAARGLDDRLIRLRPDWVRLVMGEKESRDPLDQAVPDVVGYLYYPGGQGSGKTPVGLDASRVAHWYPIPHPDDPNIGISWIGRVIPQVVAHGRATEHKGKFFENGATPNMIVTLDPTVKEESFDRWVAKFRAGNEGARNAYKTVFLGGGATSQVVGTNLQQLDFKATQGADETIIAAAAGVPPIIVGLSEGLESATYSNYAQARRRFADMTTRPLWRSFCGSMAKLVPVPSDAQLWYDDRDIPALREDARDRAEIQSTQSRSIRTLLDAGYTGDSVLAAVIAEDWSLLEHSGLFSVQLQLPQPNGPSEPTDPAIAAGRALTALIAPHFARKEPAA